MTAIKQEKVSGTKSEKNRRDMAVENRSRGLSKALKLGLGKGIAVWCVCCKMDQ